jgi:hypothetical protein
MAIELAPNALVSLPEARAFLQKEEEEEAQDEITAGLINAASGRIHEHTGREFAPKGTAPDTRVFAYSGRRMVDLYPFDVREVTAVQLGVDLAAHQQVALQASQWRLRPLPAIHGVYQQLRLPRPTAYEQLACEGEFEIAVTGLWGFNAVPETVKHWCKVTVAIWLRKDVAAFSRTLAIDDDRLEVPEGLPSSVEKGLRDFTRSPAVLPR